MLVNTKRSYGTKLEGDLLEEGIEMLSGRGFDALRRGSVSR